MFERFATDIRNEQINRTAKDITKMVSLFPFVTPCFSTTCPKCEHFIPDKEEGIDCKIAQILLDFKKFLTETSRSTLKTLLAKAKEITTKDNEPDCGCDICSDE